VIILLSLGLAQPHGLDEIANLFLSPPIADEPSEWHNSKMLSEP
jgi:hypothetical protein